jgi:DNA-binding MarR family transcriptional regulator
MPGPSGAPPANSIVHNSIVHNNKVMTEDAFRLDRQLCFALHATSRAITQAYAPLLAPLGVTYPQYLVLLVLWEEDDLTVNGLGERLYLDSGTLTPLLKRLETQGVVTRRRDARDERVVRVSLTAGGKRLRRKAEGVAHGVACAIGVSADDIATLRERLQAILFRFHETNPTTASDATNPAPRPRPRAKKQASR